MVAAEISIVMDAIPGGAEMLRELLARTDARFFVMARAKNGWNRVDLGGGEEVDKKELLIGEEKLPRKPQT